MKINLFKNVIFILLFSILATGCTLDDVIYGVMVENDNGVLKKTVHGVEFSFCLLNENGRPATIFKEGEDFWFRFQIKNNTAEALPFNDYGFYNTYDFFTVHDASASLGKPMIFLKHDTSAEAREIAPGATETFALPWHAEKEEFQLMYGYFEGIHQPDLQKGKYYTKFTYNFKFGYPGKTPQMETGKMTFFISFEVK